ncbi:MAG: hypothetical protein HKN68_08995 [Saprospiraceae bacterium]|nr:hypothetical protein [Saprospiraceae bacterium]
MTHLLNFNSLEVLLDLPIKGYNHPRFDWTGKIIDVKYKGISLAGYEKDDPKPDEYVGRGFYNEFGIERAVGFHDCGVGDWFHKIGIGLLKKDGEVYAFHHPYEIKPLEFQVQKSDTHLIIDAMSPIINGYGYKYEKELILTENGWEVHYKLDNTGSKIIETDEYNHNFIMIGEEEIGRDYILKFPFPLQPGIKGEALNPKDVIEINDNEIKLFDKPDSPFFYSFLNGEDLVDAEWKLLNLKTGIGITEKGSFLTSKVNLWGWKGAISPELFIKIKVEPGESMSWNRKFSIFEI